MASKYGRLLKVSWDFKETPLYLYSEPDVTLVIGEGEVEVKVHEYVLAPQSEFFKAALHCGLKESRERRITLPEMQLDIAIRVLNWLYRAPLVSHFDKSVQSAFSDDSTQILKEVMQSFDFLQIKGAGRDYCKLVEEILHKLNSNPINPDHIKNIITALNEVYSRDGSVSGEALDWLIEAIIRKRNVSSSWFNLTVAIERVSNPDGRFFRDISLALARRLKEALIK